MTCSGRRVEAAAIAERDRALGAQAGRVEGHARDLGRLAQRRRDLERRRASGRFRPADRGDPHRQAIQVARRGQAGRRALRQGDVEHGRRDADRDPGDQADAHEPVQRQGLEEQINHDRLSRSNMPAA